MRTIVFSDVHGEPDVIRATLAHSGFDPKRDRLIFAGDAIEVGRDSAAALALLDEVGAEFLVGNHEYAVFVGEQLEAQYLDEAVERAVADRILRGEWNLAAESQGVLVTHAGVSAYFTDEFEVAMARGTVADFAEWLNRQFHKGIAGRLMTFEGVFDGAGPLWFRPREGVAPLRGVTQVAGHTPVALLGDDEASRLAAQGFHLVDPHVRRWRAQGFPPPVPYRYAVIEDGAVRVVTT